MMRLSLPIFPSLVFSPLLSFSGVPERKGGMEIFRINFLGNKADGDAGYIGWILRFRFFLSDISACNWKSPVPSPAISDRSHTMITRQSKYHRARGRIVRFEGLLCIRLRGNKGRVSLSRLERNSSRAKSRDKSSRLSPLIYCESYLEGRGEGLAHLHLELS